MADQIPPISGAPADAPWYRWAEGHIQGNELAISRLATETDATSAGLGASVESLSQQLRDLQGRVSYSVDGTGISETWNSLQASNVPWGPQLTFTLTEPRVVSIDFAIRSNVEGTAATASTGVVAAMLGMIFIDGTPADGARGEVGVSVPIAPVPTSRYDYAIGTLACRSLAPLGEGTHTIQGGFAYRNIDVFGGAGSGSLTASDPNLFVNILQPTGA